MSARSAAAVVLCALLAACGSSSTTPTTTAATKPTGPSPAEVEAARVRQEKREREVIVARHRKLESAQQDALGATCGDLQAWAKQQCTSPSCYPVEPRDPRAGKKLGGAAVIQHRVCQRVLEGDQFGPLVVLDELPGKLRAEKFRRRFPKPHKKGSWQLPVAKWFHDEQPVRLPRGDVVVVDGKWRDLRHPVTGDTMRCVMISHYTRSVRTKLDACGGISKTVCEASGNAAARALNVIGYRLGEAQQLQRADDDSGCRDAALQALALARGLPRWRQYEKLNVGKWTEGLAYKTRFAGVLDEDQLFATATELGNEAQALYAECGGAPNAVTTVEQEQSFHTCE